MSIVWIIILFIAATHGGAFAYMIVNKIKSGQKSNRDKSSKEIKKLKVQHSRQIKKKR